MPAWALALLLAMPAQPASQATSSIHGSVTATFDTLPRAAATELRTRADVEAAYNPRSWARFRLEGFAEGLVADRGRRVTAAIASAREAWVEVGGKRADLRVGFGRIVWGRLDEVQPSDVINPLDTTRFILDGRSEARLPVAIVRGRVYAGEKLTLEGVLVPRFRRGTFDQLDEATSPFNLLSEELAGVPFAPPIDTIDRRTPRATLSNLQGGGRASMTFDRVDVDVAAYRGFENFGLVTIEPTFAPPPAPVFTLAERFPRFTMVAGDFETVTGKWAVRGETALFTEKTFLAASRPGTVSGHAIDAGVGVDRKTGEFRVFASLLFHRDWAPSDPAIERSNVDLVGSIERTFGRDRYLARAFAVVNPSDRAGFARSVFLWKMRDDVAVELSAATFFGRGDDVLSRFHGRDFVLTRIRYQW